MDTRHYYTLLLCLLAACQSVYSQTFTHGRSTSYVWPQDEAVMEKLEQWRDLKFGVLFHWGLYSYWGTVESWSICSEEEEWIPRDSTISYERYKRTYWSAIDSLNPVNFEPERWAEATAAAGMKYMVFTTKHHDGFNMFDTHYSDFSIAKGAFAGDPRSDVARYIFDAFRNKNFMIGAYFSKPDWHSQYYWWDRYATPNRGVNYDVRKNPWRWQQFEKFTFNQLSEIVSGRYGNIDILWLDGGWVRPYREGDERRPNYKGPQQIDMGRIARMARENQPGILVVDRTIAGEYENYQTPERGIPEHASEIPWESCIPLGFDWGYVPTDIYKSSGEVIRILIEITAKGGNLLLGLGPKPDGTLTEESVRIIGEVGNWLEGNGEAIYGTRIAETTRDGDVWFTLNPATGTRYAIYAPTGDSRDSIQWGHVTPSDGSELFCLTTGQAVDWTLTPDGRVSIVSNEDMDSQPAVAFSFRQ